MFRNVALTLSISMLVLMTQPQTPLGQFADQLKRTVLKVARAADCVHGITDAQPNDTVTVHYTGTLTKGGKKFDSSEEGSPITFQLGRGKVIQGWDQGLVGTCQGEKLKLEVPSQLAYGSRELGDGLIPANSDLTFEVELVKLDKALHVEELEAVRCTKDQKSRDRDIVTFDYVGNLPNGTEFGKGQDLVIEIGKTGLKGWDLGLSGMCQGGRRKVVIPPSLAYGEKGAENLVPPNSIIILDIKLKAIQNRVDSFLQRISSGTFNG